MKGFVKILLAALVGLLISANLFAGGGRQQRPGGPVKIQFWHLWQGLEAEKFLTIINRFNEQQSDIVVETLSSVTTEKMLVAMAGGTPFDVGYDMDYSVVRNGQMGALADLLPYARENGTNLNNQVQALLNMVYDGKILYGLPYTMDTAMLFYNKDILSELGYSAPPANTSEFLKMCEEAIKVNANGDYIRLGLVPDYPWMWTQVMITNLGGSFYDVRTDKVTADSMGFLQALDFYYNLYNGRYNPAGVTKFKSGLGQYQSSSNPFFQGQVLFTIEGEWYPTFIKEYAPNMNWGIAPLPVSPAGQSNVNPYLHGGMLFIPKISKNQQAAYKFIEYLIGDGPMSDICLAKGNLPSTYSVLNDSKFLAAAPELVPFVERVKDPNATAWPQIPFIGDYTLALNEEMEQMYRSGKTPQRVASAIIERIQPLADEWKAKRKGGAL
jgi:multiple sugar transport system substrate-binding protein